MEIDNYYPIKIKQLIVKYKGNLKTNMAENIEKVADYDLGVFDGEKNTYNDIVIDLLSLLVDGASYFDLEQSNNDDITLLD
ncbi:hypothetical protein SAMN04487821_11038 [Enterococcus malodoratus]|uniref:hypothetical protein n=1 Tax=Enterococcus malodoratus TaxID=71451 RepID=UPI0008D859CC|nr:hypothetical protein [Enterococcus malodoratus]SET33707.1 hypothetical protein SAMN04487821_11038 [Enterococcus malodoratus]